MKRILTFVIGQDGERKQGNYFYSPESIGSVLNKQTLREIIKKSDTPIDEDGRHRILQGKFQRVITALIMVGQLEVIGDFVEEGLDDSCLPLARKDEEAVESMILVSQQKKRTLENGKKAPMEFDLSRCMMPRRFDQFIGEQYRSMVSYLYQPGGHTPHYVFAEQEILPFREIELLDPNGDEEYSDVILPDQDGGAQSKIFGGGGFADVFRVRFHDGYFDFNGVRVSFDTLSYSFRWRHRPA